jgi:hypothetical protein
MTPVLDPNDYIIGSSHASTSSILSSSSSQPGLQRRKAISSRNSTRRRPGGPRPPPIQRQATTIHIASSADIRRLSITSTASTASSPSSFASSRTSVDSSILLTPPTTACDLPIQVVPKRPGRTVAPIHTQASLRVSLTKQASSNDIAHEAFDRASSASPPSIASPRSPSPSPSLGTPRSSVNESQSPVSQLLSPSSAYSETAPIDRVYDPRRARSIRLRMVQALARRNKRKPSSGYDETSSGALTGMSSATSDESAWPWGRSSKFGEWEREVFRSLAEERARKAEEERERGYAEWKEMAQDTRW